MGGPVGGPVGGGGAAATAWRPRPLRGGPLLGGRCLVVAAWRRHSAAAGGRAGAEQAAVPAFNLLLPPLATLACLPACLPPRRVRPQVGEAEKELGGAAATNPFAQLVDEAEGLDKIEDLQVLSWQGG